MPRAAYSTYNEPHRTQPKQCAHDRRRTQHAKEAGLTWPAHSDPFLQAALWIGMAAIALIMLMVLQIIFLRMRLRARERRSAAALARWRPVINAALAGERVANRVALRRSEAFDFFKLWLHRQGGARAGARGALNRLAGELACDRIALELLARGNRGERLLATMVLGHLGNPEAIAPLKALARTRDRLLSMHASAALVQSDPNLAAQEMAPALVFDGLWPVREVVAVLYQARQYCEPVLAGMLPGTPGQHLPRLLQVMEGLRISLPPAQLAPLLRHDSVEVLICVLRVVASPVLRRDVVGLVGHADWRVRMHAAKALGRLALRDDVPLLTKLLSDREWWVRYRSAQVLACLPFLSRGDVERIAVDASDRFAGDMLRQVLAETGGGA